MALIAGDLARTLGELVAALDRRAPRSGTHGEAAIARDAAILRERAVDLLAKLGSAMASGPAVPPRAPAPEPTTSHTAFPATPADVVALTIHEFTLDLDERNGNRAPTLERVCRTFFDDGNRALIWWIRFEALKAWCARAEVKARLKTGSCTLQDAWDQAASFPLNHHWEFESPAFSAAVESGSRLRTLQSEQGASTSKRAGAQ